MQRVALLKTRKKNSSIYFTPKDWLPPDAHYLGIYTVMPSKKKYPLYGYGEASPKWKKIRCS